VLAQPSEAVARKDRVLQAYRQERTPSRMHGRQLRLVSFVAMCARLRLRAGYARHISQLE
jgi:hypothetical protein